MSGRVFLLGLGLTLVVLAFLLTDSVLCLRPGVTQPNAHRIRVGMTLREVRAILGGEGRCISSLTHLGRRLPGCLWEWQEGSRAVLVKFDGDRVMEGARFLILDRQEFTLLDRLRAWLGW
jgi:hypothetical protein